MLIRNVWHIACICMLLLGCQKENEFIHEKPSIDVEPSYAESGGRTSTCISGIVPSQESSSGTCEMGSFSISDGAIKFTDFESFMQTINFLSCTDENGVSQWNNQVTITTVSKEFSEFMRQLCDENLTDLELENIYNNYSNIAQEQDGDYTHYRHTISTFSNFRNTEGIFLIGDRIESEWKNTRISIFDGDWSKLETIKADPNYPQNFEVYMEDPEILILRMPEYQIICCDNNNRGTHYYESNNKRISSSYDWVDASMWDIDGNDYYVTPMIEFKLQTHSEKKTFWGWRCHRRHWDYQLDMDIHVFHLPNIVEVSQGYIVNDNAWTCKVGSQNNDNARGNMIQVAARSGPYPKPWFPVLCPYDIVFEINIYPTFDDMENNNPEQTQTLECHEHAPLAICQECPPGYTFDNWSCYSGICAPGVYIYQNEFFYPDDNGACNYGGFYNNVNCYLGWFPDPGFSYFVYEDCIYAVPQCPD